MARDGVWGRCKIYGAGGLRCHRRQAFRLNLSRMALSISGRAASSREMRRSFRRSFCAQRAVWRGGKFRRGLSKKTKRNDPSFRSSRPNKNKQIVQPKLKPFVFDEPKSCGLEYVGCLPDIEAIMFFDAHAINQAQEL